jgi:hypothetical protein
MKRPAMAALGVTWAILAVVFGLCLSRNDGAFVYAVDDAYIHLAIAKNLARYGVYGVTPHETAMASSSIAWPWLLAGIRKLTGAGELVPLLLNVAAASALVLVVARSLAAMALAGTRLFAATILVVLLVPVCPLVFVGMEHTLHVLLVLLLVHEIVREDRSPSSGARLLVLASLALAATSVRYETIFVLAAVAFVQLCRDGRRAVGPLLACAAGSAVPVVLQGLWSRAHGGWFFPTSVLLKRTPLDPGTLHAILYQRLVENPHLLGVLVLLSLAYVRRRDAWIAIAFLTAILHTAFAQIGWFYRYEAYFLTLALVPLAAVGVRWLASFASLLRKERLLLVPLLLGTLPLTVRGLGSLRATPIASGNIRDQQATVASFLRETALLGSPPFAPPGQPLSVAVNDVGAVAYLTDAKLTDLMGLASPKVARMKRLRIDHGLDRAQLESLARDDGFTMAIVYEDWFAGAIPPAWRAVERWKIKDNRVCAKDTVTFYAMQESTAAALRDRLDGFARNGRLPARVERQRTPTSPVVVEE